MNVIQSAQNEKIKEIKQLQKNKNLYWWEGERFFLEVLKTSCNLKALVLTTHFLEKFGTEIKKIKSDNLLIVTDRIFSTISMTKAPQGIGGINFKQTFSLEDIIKEKAPVFYLAGLQDPGNVGTIVRIAEAFNFAGIIYEKRGASPFCEKAVRGSAGSILRVKVLQEGANVLATLQNLGYNVFLLTPHSKNATNIEKIEKKTILKAVFVLGQEGSGIDLQIPKAKNVYVPISENVESLNVAITAGIVGYICRGRLV